MAYEIDGALHQKIQPIVPFTANGPAFIVPADWSILDILFINQNSNVPTGGINLGTTAGGSDVMVGLALLGGALLKVKDAAILKNFFTAGQQQIYISAAAWNGASVSISVLLRSW